MLCIAHHSIAYNVIISYYVIEACRWGRRCTAGGGSTGARPVPGASQCVISGFYIFLSLSYLCVCLFVFKCVISGFGKGAARAPPPTGGDPRGTPAAALRSRQTQDRAPCMARCILCIVCFMIIDRIVVFKCFLLCVSCC